jgi:pyruvate/2-oxoacid:ferredoxin oxidoreductase alpha subunit
MPKELVKGNDAVIKGALLAGCQAYFGYPITPASEIAHAAAAYFPKLGRTFLQAESEVAAINMVYGASAAGVRAMTASSSPGISLKQEGISYCAGSELPCVVVDIVRGGPGLGNIAPEQGDYNQIVKGGGHGNYKVLVLAPNSAQEMCDLTKLAFDLADKYRNPAVVLADGFVGQMMEPVDFEFDIRDVPEKKWSVQGNKETRHNLISSIALDPEELEAHIKELFEKYEEAQENEVRYEEFMLDDAEIIAVAYGICSRIMISAIELARDKGMKIGLLRPISLWPFPSKRIRELCDKTKKFLVVELSMGQMVDDVRLAVEGRVPIDFYCRVGGQVPSSGELLDKIEKTFEG